MESHGNIRVLPSNAPALPVNDTPASTLHGLDRPQSPQICPNFNLGLDCICSLKHICATCLGQNHGSKDCKTGVLRITSGNVRSHTREKSVIRSKAGLDTQCQNAESSFLFDPPHHSAQAALKLEQKKRRRARGPHVRASLSYRPELQSPRYVAYRQKIKQSQGNSSKKQIWPDHVEEAFQEGIHTASL